MKPYSEILYVSNVCSNKLITQIFETSKQKPRQSAQKFHSLLIEGFALHKDACHIQTLSLIPVTSTSHKKKMWKSSPEQVGDITFNYIPIINLPALKDVMVFIYSFFKVLRWSLSKNRKHKVVICDALKFSISSGAILACKFSGVQVLGIITDLPNLMIGHKKKYDLKYILYKRLSFSIISNFDKYIILTAQMNEVVNPHHKPFMVMEGLVDIKMERKDNSLSMKDPNRILLYAGGIYEEYGIRSLIDAFVKLNDDNLRLHIYGPGNMENDMPNYMKLDNRIVYKGIIPNSEVVESQLRATLLINPRPTTEDFTKFSFPSKNMEYMVSGTPVVTTKLPGMPLEYYEYVYLFEEESVEGMTNTLKDLLAKSEKELICLGTSARQFVLHNKSNRIQAKRILDFIKMS